MSKWAFFVSWREAQFALAVPGSVHRRVLLLCAGRSHSVSQEFHPFVVGGSLLDREVRFYIQSRISVVGLVGRDAVRVPRCTSQVRKGQTDKSLPVRTQEGKPSNRQTDKPTNGRTGKKALGLKSKPH